jgi:methionyl aminopeptidase
VTNPIPIKTKSEIEILKKAGSILTATLDELGKHVCPGISTLELDRVAEEFIRSHEGAIPGFKGYYGFPGSVCVSINDEAVHGIPGSGRILKSGDIVGLDCGVQMQKLNTDACRTYLVGEVDSEVIFFVNKTKEALSRAIKQVRSGGRIGDISAVIQRSLERYGYSPVIECTGHGVGYELHEAPEILNAGTKGTGPEMKAGMVLAIEPISAMGGGAVVTDQDQWTIRTADRSLSAHFEATVVVTEGGYEIIAS